MCRILLLTLIVSSLSLHGASRPNIVYFYADDLGWGTIKANKPDSKLLTPNIDALAANGINFTRGYGCMVCSPARSSQQTGFHQGHTWTDRNDPAPTKAIRVEDIAIGDVLQAAGYRTAYYGKWGYGADSDKINPPINNPQTLPINHGYDEILAELHHVRAHTYFQPTLWRSNTNDPVPTTALITNTIAANNPLHPNYPAYQDDATYPSTAYCDDSYAFAALDFVRTNALAGQPFFMELAFQIPHTPLGNIDGLPQWFDAYAGVTGSGSWAAENKQFAAMVTRMDGHIGNIIAVLDDPNNDGDKSDSVLDNTLIIFASDNGGQGGTPYEFFKTNGPLSGTKGSIKEGGIRVPTVMSWRGTIAAGQSTDMPVDVTDMLPTFAELAGVPSPVGTDGVSIAPTLTGQGVQRAREFLSHESGTTWSVIKGDMKLRNDGKLFDLSTDPAEQTNIAGANPTLVTELQAYAAGEQLGKTGITFSNSFRTWEGSNGSPFEADASWSDAAYPSGNALANDYSPNTPNLRWNAVMKNTTSEDSSTSLANDEQLLAIEVGGNTVSGNTQTVNVSNGLTLTGRNEIRISELGVMALNNGTLDTLRWVDLFNTATLSGAGSITGALYHSGDLKMTQSSDTTVPGPDITVPGTDITIIDGHQFISNGGFENGTDTGGGDYSYDTLVDWFTDGVDPSKDGAKPSSSHTGNYRSLIQAGYPIVQTTAFPFIIGDSFTLVFWHQGFNNWSTGELAKVEVFYEDNNQNRVILFTDTFPMTNGTWVEASYTIPAIADANAAGKAVQILLGPDTGNGFASFDDVSLVRHGAETTVPGPDITVPGPDITILGNRKMSIAKLYHASTTAKLNLELAGTATPGTDYAQLLVTDSAHLDGTLIVTLDATYTPVENDTYTIITANTISGRFQHADDMIESGGHHFQITTATQEVTLQKVATTAKGTPLWWLTDHGLGTDDLTDPDGDGISSWEEYIAGTDPQNRQSAMTISIQLNTSTGNNEVHWQSESDRLYYIERSTDLVGFTTIEGPLDSTPGPQTFVLPDEAGTHVFYRLKVERK